MLFTFPRGFNVTLNALATWSSVPINPADIKTKSAGIVCSLPATGTISTRLVSLFSFGSNETITASFTWPFLSRINSFTVVW